MTAPRPICFLSDYGYEDDFAGTCRGVIASFGNAGGVEFCTSVFPFILRGVRLIGVNSDNPPEFRRQVWARLGADLHPRHLARIAHPIALDDLTAHCERLIAGAYEGRALVGFS